MSQMKLYTLPKKNLPSIAFPSGHFPLQHKTYTPMSVWDKGSVNTILVNLHWRVPTAVDGQSVIEPCPIHSMPPALLPLRHAVATSASFSAHPKTSTPLLIRYAAALQVAQNLRPDLQSGLQSEQSRVFHALAYHFEKLALAESLSKNFAGRLNYLLASREALRLSGQFSAHVTRLQLEQCRALFLFDSTHSYRTAAHVYEKAQSQCVDDPACHMHLLASEAYWRALALMEHAPAAMPKHEEAQYAIGHILETKRLRARHYEAALLTVQQPWRVLQSAVETSSFSSTLLKSTLQNHVEQCGKATALLIQERDAHLTATGHYEEFEKNLPSASPLALPDLQIPMGPEEKDLPMLEAHYPLDELEKILRKEMDTWALTEAAVSLTRSQVQEGGTIAPMLIKKPQYSLAEIMHHVLGAPLPPTFWPAGILAALTLRIQQLSTGEISDGGGLNRVKDIDRLKAKRTELTVAMSMH